MKKKILALVAALMFSSLSFAAALAQDEYYYSSARVTFDGTPCYKQVGDEYPWTLLDADTEVPVFTDPSETWVLIGVYPDDDYNRNSCWVESWTINPGMGEPPVIEPVEPQGTIIYEDIVNADDVLCRASPSFDGEVVTSLFEGERVGVYDVVIDGWQKVGLEATWCYVWYEFIGPVTEPEVPTEVPTAEPTEIVEEESPTIEPVDTGTLEEEEAEATSSPIEPVGGIVVTKLPSTGSGDAAEDDYSWEDLAVEISGTAGFVLTVFVGGPLLFLVAWKFLAEHHVAERLKKARKDILRHLS